MINHDRRIRIRRPLGPICVMVMALLWTVFADATAHADSVVRIAGSAWVADAPTKVAEALGYFNAAGVGAVPVQIQYYDSGKEALDALLRGEAEFALAASTPVALALMGVSTPPGWTDPGTPNVVILASLSLSSQSHYIVARRSAGITVPADLVGRRIGLMSGTSAHYAWSRFARYHGLHDHRVTRVHIPISEQRSAMAAGRMDAVVSWDPWGWDLQQDLGDDAIVFSVREVYSENWLLVTRSELAQRDRGLAAGVLEGYRRAIDLIQKDPIAARRIHARITGLPEDLLARLENAFIWRFGLDWSVLANMEAQFVWVREWPGMLNHAPPLPVRYLDARPLLQIGPQYVRLPSYLHGGWQP